MYEHEIDVMVVGAGLGGLSATMFLAQQGTRVLAVERHPGTALHPRATGQNWRTMELLGYAGIAGDVLTASGRASAGLRITIAASLGGPVFEQLLDDVDAIDVDAATPMRHGMAGQDIVEPIMLAQAERFGAEVRFNSELIAFDQDDSGVTAQVRHREHAEPTTVRASYLVAADGGASRVRDQLGIHTDGVGAIGHCIGVVFDADLTELLHPTRTELYYLRNEHFSAGFANTDIPGRFVFAPDYHPEEGETPADFTHERLVELIRIATAIPELEPKIRWVGPWDMAAEVARTFRAGRVFLVGDAAKVTPPTGGLGGNTAVADGNDIAWKLATVLRAEAGHGLLETYHDERKPIAEMVVNTSLHNAKHRMSVDIDDSALADPTDQLELILGFRYRSTAVLPDAHEPDGTEDPRHPSGRAGSRAPHVPIVIAGRNQSTVDLFGVRWVLLVGPDGGDWLPAESTELGVRLRCHQLGRDFTEEAGLFLQRYGLNPAGVSLVRPDGIVAWRSVGSTERPVETLRDVFAHVLSRSATGD